MRCFLRLRGERWGSADAGAARPVTPYVRLELDRPSSSGPAGVYADGTSTGTVVVQLLDANSNSIAARQLRSTPRRQPNDNSTERCHRRTAGAFTLTDVAVEMPNLTATDTTDDVVKLSPTPTFPFITPPAVSASIGAISPVANDGTSDSVITVTLEDSLGRGTPGKLVDLSQTGNSVITGLSPQVTGSNGKITFNVTDLASEAVTYSAVDVTDGSLRSRALPCRGFQRRPEQRLRQPRSRRRAWIRRHTLCDRLHGPEPHYRRRLRRQFRLPGSDRYRVRLVRESVRQRVHTGNIYKFPPGGGVAGSGTKLNSTSLGQTLAGLVFDSSGNLFASLDVSSSDSTTGSILRLNPSNGTVTRTISSTEICPTTISIDPLSGDLFTDDTCTDSYANASVWRVSDPDGASPSTSVYTTLSSTPNATLAFAPGGTIYAWTFTGSEVNVTEISGTNGPTTPTVSILPGLQLANLGLLAGGTGAGTYLIGTPFVNDATVGLNEVDLTTSAPTLATALATKAGANFLTIGTDGCIYASQGPTVFRITDTARRLHLCERARVSDTRALANFGAAQSGAGDLASLQCDTPLCDCSRWYAGPVRRHRRQSADSAGAHQRRRTSVIQLRGH